MCTIVRIGMHMLRSTATANAIYSTMPIPRRNQPMITATHLVVCIGSVFRIIATQLPRVIA